MLNVKNVIRSPSITGLRCRNLPVCPLKIVPACHKDVHDNKFGQNCAQCHSEESFRRIKQLKNFNHSLTNLSPDGKASVCGLCQLS